MLGIGIRCPKDATLLGGPNHKRHIKSQSFKIAYDEAIVTEWLISKMGILLSQYDMQFLPQKAVKGQAVADFLAKYPDQRVTKFYEDLPDEIAEACLTQTSFEEQVWQLFFNGASRTSPQGNIIAEVGVVLVSSQNYVIPHAFSLIKSCSNNIAEYNVLLIRMQIVDEIGVKNFKAYGDSKLTINQIHVSTKSDMKIWYPIITQLSTWQRGSKTSTSTMYLANKIRIQMHLHLSLLLLLFQLERQRKYPSTDMTCTVRDLPLKTTKSQQENFKSKKL